MPNLTGNSKLDAGQIPTGSGKSPGVTQLQAFQVGKVRTDAAGDDSAMLRMEMGGSSKATYTYLITATAPYATPQDWVVIRGSASKVVTVVRTAFIGFATAATNILFTYKKHTVANTGGTSTNPAFIKRDTGDGAATALVLLYTVAPTTDATAVIVENVWYPLGITMGASTALPTPVVHDYTLGAYEPWVLHGVAEEFAINFGGVAVPAGGLYTYEITITEE